MPLSPASSSANIANAAAINNNHRTAAEVDPKTSPPAQTASCEVRLAMQNVANTSVSLATPNLPQVKIVSHYEEALTAFPGLRAVSSSNATDGLVAIHANQSTELDLPPALPVRMDELNKWYASLPEAQQNKVTISPNEIKEKTQIEPGSVYIHPNVGADNEQTYTLKLYMSGGDANNNGLPGLSFERVKSAVQNHFVVQGARQSYLLGRDTSLADSPGSPPPIPPKRSSGSPPPIPPRVSPHVAAATNASSPIGRSVSYNTQAVDFAKMSNSDAEYAANAIVNDVLSFYTTNHKCIFHQGKTKITGDPSKINIWITRNSEVGVYAPSMSNDKYVCQNGDELKIMIIQIVADAAEKIGRSASYSAQAVDFTEMSESNVEHVASFIIDQVLSKDTSDLKYILHTNGNRTIDNVSDIHIWRGRNNQVTVRAPGAEGKYITCKNRTELKFTLTRISEAAMNRFSPRQAPSS